MEGGSSLGTKIEAFLDRYPGLSLFFGLMLAGAMLLVIVSFVSALLPWYGYVFLHFCQMLVYVGGMVLSLAIARFEGFEEEGRYHDEQQRLFLASLLAALVYYVFFLQWAQFCFPMIFRPGYDRLAVWVSAVLLALPFVYFVTTDASSRFVFFERFWAFMLGVAEVNTGLGLCEDFLGLEKVSISVCERTEQSQPQPKSYNPALVKRKNELYHGNKNNNRRRGRTRK